MFGGKKGTGLPQPPGTSSGGARLGTASRTLQQQNSVTGAPPGSASRRPQTGSGGQRRPTTAVQGAGFTTGSIAGSAAATGPSQFEKKEETYVYMY